MNEQLAINGGPKTVNLAPPIYPVIGHEEITGAVRALMQRQLSVTTHAGVVGEMEDAFASYFGAKYCHSFNSGTAAIHSALFAVGVRPGDKVLTASNTWISAICAICHAGAVPVFCDTAPDSEWIDPAEIRRKGKDPLVKAVIATHLYGTPADMDGIMAAAGENGLKVVEDVSHAHGGKYKGRYLGTIGDAGCFSLQGSKAIVAGEGGFLLTNDKLIYERSMIPGDHGTRLKSELTLDELAPFTKGGGAWTYRIAPTCAAVALAQLDRLETLNAARQANFEQLRDRLAKDAPFIAWHPLDEGSVRGWYGAPALYTHDQQQVSRDLFVDACRAEGAPVNSNGYQNWYQVPMFQDLDVFGQLFPVEHVSGARFEPLPAGALKNNESLRQRHLHIGIPAERCPQYMAQVGNAIVKVARRFDELAERQAQQSGAVAAAVG